MGKEVPSASSDVLVESRARGHLSEYMLWRGAKRGNRGGTG